MADRRHKNSAWLLNLNSDGTVPTADAHLAVLMDIRDELQRLNRVFACPNFQAVPRILRGIQSNTKKKKRLRLVKSKSA